MDPEGDAFASYHFTMAEFIKLKKDDLRRHSKEIRAGITAGEVRQASKTICSWIESWQSFKGASTVLTYLSMRNEPDLTLLFSHCPQKKWVIPCIRPAGRMTFHTYDKSTLTRHPLGMLEPDPESPVTVPDDIDCVLVPGLAFERSGWRLGYGGGFYDRFLAGFMGASAGITYDRLLFDQIPHDSHDIPVQYVATESGIYTISSG